MTVTPAMKPAGEMHSTLSACELQPAPAPILVLALFKPTIKRLLESAQSNEQLKQGSLLLTIISQSRPLSRCFGVFGFFLRFLFWLTLNQSNNDGAMLGL